MTKDKVKLQTKIRDVIYDYVYECFEESEANDPSWVIKAPTLEDKIKVIKTIKADITKIIKGE